MRLLVTSGYLLPGDDIKEPAAEERSLNSPEESEDSEGPFLVGWDSAGLNFLTFWGDIQHQAFQVKGTISLC